MMTAYLRKSFSVGAPASEEFRDNWERTFRGDVSAAEKVVLKELPRDVTRDVQALFEAAELVLSVEHPKGRLLADELRALAMQIAAEAKGRMLELPR